MISCQITTAHFWDEVQAVEESGGVYPAGAEDLLICFEHHWLLDEWLEQPEWWRDDFRLYRALKIRGENAREKRAARKRKKGM